MSLAVTRSLGAEEWRTLNLIYDNEKTHTITWLLATNGIPFDTIRRLSTEGELGLLDLRNSAGEPMSAERVLAQPGNCHTTLTLQGRNVIGRDPQNRLLRTCRNHNGWLRLEKVLNIGNVDSDTIRAMAANRLISVSDAVTIRDLEYLPPEVFVRPRNYVVRITTRGREYVP